MSWFRTYISNKNSDLRDVLEWERSRLQQVLISSSRRLIYPTRNLDAQSMISDVLFVQNFQIPAAPEPFFLLFSIWPGIVASLICCCSYYCCLHEKKISCTEAFRARNITFLVFSHPEPPQPGTSGSARPGPAEESLLIWLVKVVYVGLM